MTIVDESRKLEADDDLPISEDVFAALDFSLAYSCPAATHTVVRHAPHVNMWRDVLPAGLDLAVIGQRAGGRVERAYGASELAGTRQQGLVRVIPVRHFDSNPAPGIRCQPDVGRFLPQGTLFRAGLAGVYRDSMRPFRVLDVGDDSLIADLNDPFAGFDATIAVDVRAVMPKRSDVGGRCQDWTRTLIQGTGMQVRVGERPTEFFTNDWNARVADSNDAEFYAMPRLVAHLDRRAIETITSLYGTLLKPGMRVLDLMSSVYSHLPERLESAHVVGLGMNAAELDANPRLDQRVVHDLNAQPKLPFETASFDAVVCTASIEYLTQPLAVVREVARVLRPGSIFAVTYSNRWFPPKVIKVWRDAHPMESMGLVLEYFLRGGGFEDLHTLSVEGHPRPDDDPHIRETSESDPVQAVWGRRRSG